MSPQRGVGHESGSPAMAEFDDSTSARDGVMARIPLGHLDGLGGRHVTGTTLVIDGGFNYLR
jgi:hypothetical protein